MKKQLITLTLFTALLAACGENTKTEEWYISHPEELKKAVEKCKLKTTEEMIKDIHCQMIEAAKLKAWHEQQKNAPLPKYNFK